MPQLTFAANLTMLFQEYPLPERFAAARRAGFEAVEILFPYDRPLDLLARCLTAQSQRLVLINAPAGDWAAGERGLACLPGRQAEFRESLAEGIAACRQLQVPQMHVMAGIAPEGADKDELRAVYHENLTYALTRVEAARIALNIEPINSYDMPGYFLDSFPAAAHTLFALEKAGPNLRLQFDIYHCARIHQTVVPWIEALASRIGHFQLAGTPDRHEPDIGTLPYKYILGEVARHAPGRFIGLEYHPKGNTAQGLNWLSEV